MYSQSDDMWLHKYLKILFLQATVLGYYDFTSSAHLPKGFMSFYLASLRALQHDNTNAIAWGVVTNPQTARALSFNGTKSVHLVLWNTTLVSVLGFCSLVLSIFIFIIDYYLYE